MAKTYYTFRIRLANDKSVRVEKWGDDYKLIGEFSRSFRYQEKREEIDSQLKPVFANELNDSLQARKLGEYLFEAIFDDVLRQEFVNFYQEVVRNQKQFLRIELDIDEVAMPDVAALPWEFMCLPASANLGECRFATDPNLVFSRRRPRSHSPNPIQLEKGEKLRIALAIAAPEGLGPVEYQEVQEALEILAHEQAQRIELLPIVNPATPTAIDKLLERKPHIFHFIGHGQMQNETGEEVGQIALVKKAFNKTKSLWMDADSFSELFNRWSPGVVLLQACESGMLSASKVFAGAASKIVQMNIPVVVAMQYEVSNATASKFAYEFYQRLAKGEPVDIAAQNGRRTIGLETVHRKRDFATPVIFMGVENGYLFRSQETNKLTDLLGISKGKQENSPGLDLSAIPPGSIQQAYQKALPPDANLSDDLEENDISQVLEILKQYRRVGVFYELLSQDENIVLGMRQKFQEEAKKHPQENKTRQTGKNFSEEKEYYLIATLEEENSSQKSTEAGQKKSNISDDKKPAFYPQKLKESNLAQYEESKLFNASLTLYAFHLRHSISDRVVPEASDLWDKLAEFGDILKIEELQNIRQKLICYEDNQYDPEAEDQQEKERLTLLRDGKNELRFSISSELKGMLCPFRLHDTYGIDFTVSSKETVTLKQLKSLNPEYLLLPSKIPASLGQTLFFWSELLEDEGDYRGLADACVAQLIPDESEHNFIDLIAEGSFLGNPIFEYESTHKSQAKRLHILVCFERETIALEPIDKLLEIIFYVLWLRHKILYVYEQSQLCAKDAKLLSAQIEEFGRNQNFPDFIELQNMDFQYAEYIRHLRDYQTTIGVNEENYRVQREKIAAFPKSDFNFLDKFFSLVRDKFKKQIEVNLGYLEPGKERLQQLLAMVRASRS